MKKLLMLMVIMVFTVTMVAGCGNKVETPANSDGTTTEAPSYTIRVAHVCGGGSPFDYGAQNFKKLVEERSNGRITVEVFAGDMTTDEIEGVEMVQSGNLEIMWCSTGSIGGFVPNLSIFEMPFLFDDPEHVERALASKFGTQILEEVSAVDGLEAIAFHEDGWRNILTKDVVINSLEDMKGVRIRSMMNEVCVDMYKALGANPISVSSGEIYTSLQTNVVSGEDNSFLYAVADGYIEALNSAAIIHHFYSSGIVVGSDSWWSGLNAEDQKLIQTAAQEAGAAQRAWFLDSDEALIEKYKAEGFTITYPEDRDAWRAAVQPVYEKQYAAHPEWKELVGIIDSVR